MITSNRESSAIGLGLFQYHGACKLPVCDIFTSGLWDFIFAYEFDSFGGFLDSSAHTVGQLSKSFSGQEVPLPFVVRVLHELSAIEYFA